MDGHRRGSASGVKLWVTVRSAPTRRADQLGAPGALTPWGHSHGVRTSTRGQPASSGRGHAPLLWHRDDDLDLGEPRSTPGSAQLDMTVRRGALGPPVTVNRTPSAPFAAAAGGASPRRLARSSDARVHARHMRNRGRWPRSSPPRSPRRTSRSRPGTPARRAAGPGRRSAGPAPSSRELPDPPDPSPMSVPQMTMPTTPAPTRMLTYALAPRRGRSRRRRASGRREP